MSESTTTPRIDAARARRMRETYRAKGWRPLPVPFREKGPDHEWLGKKFTEEDFDREPDANTGVELGEPSDWLVDVDVDAPEALASAARLLPTTPLVFGRSGKPRSHYLYRAENCKNKKAFKDPIDNTSIVELRAGKHQTVFPPSVHNTGEPIEWADGVDTTAAPGSVDAGGLADMVRAVAISTVLGKHWPGKGARNDAALKVGGFLAYRGLDPKTVAEIVTCACAVAGDEEADHRAKTARDSVEKRIAGERVTGSLDELFDAKVVSWLKAQFAPVAEGIDASEQDLAKVTAEAWDAVVRKNDPPRMFRRGGVPVRVERNDDGRTVLVPLDVDKLRHEAARATPWFTRTRSGAAPAKPPTDVIRDMLAQPEIPLPVVTRVVSAPVVAADGTVQTATGYQHATRTYYPSPGLAIPPVADAPSPADVARAVALVRDEVLADFPFVAAAERAHAFAAFLLPFVREMIDGPTPLHLIEKPNVGTGATLLATVLTYPALGEAPPMLTQADGSEEWRKRISSTLAGGPSVVVFDNVTLLANESLAAALTAATWADRILGKTENLGVPVRCAWLATGNNPQLSAEIARRTVRIRLDARRDRPWMHRPEKGFRHDDLEAWVIDHRGNLVWAALTIARAWVVAGRPRGRGTLGKFESWSWTIGGMLAVAGVRGFLENLETFYESSDIEGEAIRWFVAEWRTRHRFKAVTSGELYLLGMADGSPLHMMIEGKTDKQLNAKFGYFVKGLRDRVYTLDDGTSVRIEAAGKSRSGATWRLNPGVGESERPASGEAAHLF